MTDIHFETAKHYIFYCDYHNILLKYMSYIVLMAVSLVRINVYQAIYD